MGNCACCLPATFGARTVVIVGTPQAGTSTVVRRLASSSELAPRAAGARDEQWPALPLPSAGLDDSWPVRRVEGTSVRLVDTGPVLQPAFPDSKLLQAHLEKCGGAVLVLDASRTLQAQRALEAYAVLNRGKGRSAPLVVLLNKYDARELHLTPAHVADSLALDDRPAQWQVYPCVASHRHFDGDRVLGNLLDASTVSALPLIGIGDDSSHPAGAHAGPARAHCSAEYVEYNDNTEHPQPSAPPLGAAPAPSVPPAPTPSPKGALAKTKFRTPHAASVEHEPLTANASQSVTVQPVMKKALDKPKPSGYLRLARV